MAMATIPGLGLPPMPPNVSLNPDFIRFLFSSKPKFDCYFKVGNRNQGKLERIGAVKLMLMAHSEVFRLELEDSELKDKQDVPIKDIHPDTFKGMLKYVYGYDTTSVMEFDEADNLFYVAEKYMIKTLKDKLAVRLMELLNPGNICSLLNNPACHTHLELDSAITKILRYETDRVLASPQFVWMNADGFLQILQQDGLVVPEIELWRAAIKWAKHKAASGDGRMIREQLCGLLPHMRLCTLTADEFCTEVAPTEVLTDSQLSAVCLSIGKKAKLEHLTSVSNEIVPRKRLNVAVKPNEDEEFCFLKGMTCELKLVGLRATSTASSNSYSFTLLTKQNSIELLPLVWRSRDRNHMEPEHWTYEVYFTATITKIANPNNPSDIEPPVNVACSGNVKCGVEFITPLAVDGKNIILLPDTKYSVNMRMVGGHIYYRTIPQLSRGLKGNDDLTLQHGQPWSFPSKELQYRVVTALH